MQNAINIGSHREVFWDEYLIDTEKTTARFELHHLQPKEVVLNHDDMWEGDGCDYHNIVADDGLYRMYYLGFNSLDPTGTKHVPDRQIRVCYAESRDGIKWYKPNLGICEYNGLTENNIILDVKTAKFDNFQVFKDSNPACPAEERYKGIGVDCTEKCENRWLWCFTSADGIHFKKAWRMTKKGAFDSLNVALWDNRGSQYICYIRDFHNDIRDIRWMTSKDFKEWTDPVLLDFGGADDYPLYTNAVQKYYRADLFIGFPSRYVQRKEWTENFAQMPGADRRRLRIKAEPRLGLSITDCVFMSSRDGKKWKRWDEAFMTPGPEYTYNWVYGDCYPTLGMIETENDIRELPNEISMFANIERRSMKYVRLRRYTIRIDGFVSYKATYKPCAIVTKPFIYCGSELYMNLATSARGYIRVKLICGEKTLESIEHFGDSLDRRIVFQNGSVAEFSGKVVVMEIEMSDADIYSLKFES